ncbi:RidA family protein [candidate division KSB1 bacterium]|nr:RidA family protein [candidate division KSB1 bacterium]
MKRVISTDKAPAAVGPYSQAIVASASSFVFTAGQIGINPDTKKIVTGGIQAETRQVLENLKAVLKAAGSDIDQVIKCTVFLTDMANFGAMNEIYESYFKLNPPARSAVAVKQLPLNAQVEIEAIAMATA